MTVDNGPNCFIFHHTKQERTMKSTWLPALLVVLAAGCAPPPSGTDSPPDSNTSSSDLSISIPGDEGTDAGTDVKTTLVSLSIPGMT
jgi:hypothetical protein